MKRLVIFLFVFSLVSGLVAQNYTYDKWLREYEKAESELKAGKAIQTIGLVGSLLGLVPIAVNFANREKTRPLYMGIFLGGLGLSGIGYGVKEKASKKIHNLKVIGHEKGYLSASIQPEYKGASLSIRILF